MAQSEVKYQGLTVSVLKLGVPGSLWEVSLTQIDTEP
jgi:hypothetical protein